MTFQLFPRAHGLVGPVWSFKRKLLLTSSSLSQPAASPALPPVGGTDTPSCCLIYQLLACCHSVSKVLVTLYFPLSLILLQK